MLANSSIISSSSIDINIFGKNIDCSIFVVMCNVHVMSSKIT